VVGVCKEANTSGGEVQDTSPEEDFDMIDQDQPQREGGELEYKEYLTDIPDKLDSEDTDAQEWDEAHDNKTQTKYHNRKCMFMAKHMNNDVLSASKQELMYDYQLRKKTLSGQPDCQSKMQLISAYWDIGGTKAHCLLDSGCERTMMSPNFVCTTKLWSVPLEQSVNLQLAKV
jgi:hypothetical protein